MSTITAPATGSKPHVGRVVQVIGSTFDAEFSQAQMPAIYNAVKIVGHQKGVELNLTGEVQQHLGGGRVRCVALGNTDGMVRGMDCLDTGAPVKVPVGKATLGRVFNLVGETIDGLAAHPGRGILAHPPRCPAGRRSFHEDGNLRDGHQGDRLVDAVCPRGEGGVVRRGRAGQNCHPHRVDRPHRQRPRRLLRLRRRRRAHPRGKRPLAGNAGTRRSARPAATCFRRPAWCSGR